MRGLVRAFGACGGLFVVLACGGLPAAGDEIVTNDGAEVPVPTDGATDGGTPDAEPETPPAPEPGATPESLFDALDAAEVPPTGAPKCGEGLGIIRHPRNNGIAVYCADGAGKKQGGLHLMKGSKVIELTEYADGKKTGRSVRWNAATPPVKLAESRWAADVQDGEACEWDEQGNVVVRGKWVAGQRVGKFIESTANKDAPPTFGGKCHDGAGAEVWATTDPAEFVSKSCP